MIRRYSLQALIALGFLIIAAVGLRGEWNRLVYTVQKDKILVDRHMDRSHSLDVLRDSKSENFKKAEALHRLAVLDAPAAMDFARQWLKNGDYDLARAAIQTMKLSHDPQDEAALLEMYSGLDKHPENQRFGQDLIDSLTGMPASLATLYKIAGLSWTRKVERVRIYGAICQRETDPEQRKKIVAHLKGVARTAQGDEKTQAILSLSAVLPNDPDVIQLLRGVLQKQELDLIGYAAMHLAKIKDAWLTQHYKELLGSSDAAVQSAILRAIPYFCPKQPASPLRKVYEGSDDVRIRTLAVAAAASYKDSETRALLQEAIADKKVDDRTRQMFRDQMAVASAPDHAGCD